MDGVMLDEDEMEDLQFWADYAEREVDSRRGFPPPLARLLRSLADASSGPKVVPDTFHLSTKNHQQLTNDWNESRETI